MECVWIYLSLTPFNYYSCPSKMMWIEDTGTWIGYFNVDKKSNNEDRIMQCGFKF